MIRKTIKGGNFKPQMIGELEFDQVPEEGSFNPVTSDAVVKAIDEAKEDMQEKIDEVTLDPSAVALGNVHLLDEVTELPADGCILIDSETNGPGEMSKDTLLELTAQNALAGNVAPPFDPTKPNDEGGYAYYINEKVTFTGGYYVFVKNHASGPWVSSDVRKISINDDIQWLANASIKCEQDCKRNSECIDNALVSETQSGTSVVVNSDTAVLTYAKSSSDLSLKIENANVLYYPYKRSSGGTGITWTLNDDGSVSADGTSSDVNQYTIVGDASSERKPIKAGTYVFKGAPSDSGAYIVIGVTGDREYYAFAGASQSVTISADTTYYFALRVRAGTTLSSAVFKPELVRQDIPLVDFDIHREKTIEIGASAILLELWNGYNVLSASSSFDVEVKKFKFSQGGFVDLGDYCEGDGIADDSNGIQMALNDAAGGTLMVPSGTFLFSKTLVVPSNTKVVGQGSSSVFKLATSYSLTAVAWRSGTAASKHPYIMTAESSENVTLENFTLVGQTSGFVDENEDGIMVQGKMHKLSRLLVHDINFYPDDFSGRSCLCPAWGIDLINASNCVVENVRVYNCGYEDIGTESSDNITIRDSSFGDGVQTRVQVHRLSTNIHILNNDITHENLTRTYITLDANPDTPMNNIFIENNRIYGYCTNVAGGENNVYWIGNYFGSELNHQNTVTTASNWIITNNHFKDCISLNVDNVVVSNNIIENIYNREYAITLVGTEDSHVAHIGNLVLAGQEINIVTE